MEFWIWLIIMVIMAIAKGFEKLAEASRQPPAEPTSPETSQRPPKTKRPPRSRQPKPHRAPPPVRPSAPPVVTPPPRAQPVRSRTEFPQLPQPAMPAPAPTAAVPGVEPPRRTERARLCAGVLRDRQTLRSLILAREILGRPRSLREYEESGWQPG